MFVYDEMSESVIDSDRQIQVTSMGPVFGSKYDKEEIGALCITHLEWDIMVGYKVRIFDQEQITEFDENGEVVRSEMIYGPDPRTAIRVPDVPIEFVNPADGDVSILPGDIADIIIEAAVKLLEADDNGRSRVEFFEAEQFRKRFIAPNP
jgi:hypothetical protein